MPGRSRNRGRTNPRTVAVLLVLVLVVVALARAHNHSSNLHGSTVIQLSLRAGDLAPSLEVALVRPPRAGAARPLLVLLPDAPAQPGTSLTSSMLGALADLGSRAPDLALPSGPASAYSVPPSRTSWQRYVLGTVIPAAIARLHADPRRVTIGGVGAGGLAAAAMSRADIAGTLCRGPAGASISLRQVQQSPNTTSFQGSSSDQTTTSAVYDYLSSYATALSTCSRSARG
jgi:hypothetical protein